MTLTRLQQQIKQHRPFRSPEQEAYLNVIRTADRLRDRLSLALRPYGLTEAGYNVLKILRGAKRDQASDHVGLASMEISRRLVSRVPDVTRIVDKLESERLVERRRGEADKRVIQVRITPKGARLVAKAEGPLDAVSRQLAGHMSKQDIQTLSRLLEQLREPLEDQPQPEA